MFTSDTVTNLTPAQLQDVIGEDEGVRTERLDATTKLTALSRALQNLVSFEREEDLMNREREAASGLSISPFESSAPTEAGDVTCRKRPFKDLSEGEGGRHRPAKSRKTK